MDLLKDAGISTPKGFVARTPEEAYTVAKEIGMGFLLSTGTKLYFSWELAVKKNQEAIYSCVKYTTWEFIDDFNILTGEIFKQCLQMKHKMCMTYRFS